MDDIKKDDMSKKIIESFVKCAKEADEFVKTYSSLYKSFDLLDEKLTQLNSEGVYGRELVGSIDNKLKDLNKIIKNLPEMSNQVIKINKIIKNNGEIFKETADKLEDYKEDIDNITEITEKLKDFKEIAEAYSGENFEKYLSDIKEAFKEVNKFYSSSKNMFKKQTDDYKKEIKNFTQHVKIETNKLIGYIEKNEKNYKQSIEKVEQLLINEKAQSGQIGEELLKKVNDEINLLKSDNSKRSNEILERIISINENEKNSKNIIDELTKYDSISLEMIKSLNNEIRQLRGDNEKNFSISDKRIDEIESTISKSDKLNKEMNKSTSQEIKVLFSDELEQFKNDLFSEVFEKMEELFEKNSNTQAIGSKGYIKLYTLKELLEKNRKFPFETIDNSDEKRDVYQIRKFTDNMATVYVVLGQKKVKIDYELDIHEKKYEWIEDE